MSDLTLCIYDDLVVDGSEEYKLLESLRSGENIIEILGIKYAVTQMDSERFSHIDRYLKNAMNRTTITASRLIPMVYP